MRVAWGGYSPGEVRDSATTAVSVPAPDVLAVNVFETGIFRKHLVP
jgi:hypothetical protein